MHWHPIFNSDTQLFLALCGLGGQAELNPSCKQPPKHSSTSTRKYIYCNRGPRTSFPSYCGHGLSYSPTGTAKINGSNISKGYRFCRCQEPNNISGWKAISFDTPIWVWVKIRYPNNWMVNTKLDISICGPTSVFHFDPIFSQNRTSPQRVSTCGHHTLQIICLIHLCFLFLGQKRGLGHHGKPCEMTPK